jgi:hypothetical protein
VIATLAAIAIAVNVHPGYGGTCVDVTVAGRTVADTLCPPRADLAVRSFPAGGRTIYFGALRHRARSVRLIFPRVTLRTRVTRERGWAAAGGPVLGAIRVGRRVRDIDPFGLPPVGRRVNLLTLTDEQGRRPTVVAAAPRVLSRGKRRKALCIGLRLPGATTPGRRICAVDPLKVDVRFSAECRSRQQVVFGVGPSHIRRARATLSNGTTAPVDVTRVPRRVRRPGVVFSADFSGPMATKVTTYDADGDAVASARLLGGCAS